MGFIDRLKWLLFGDGEAPKRKPATRKRVQRKPQTQKKSVKIKRVVRASSDTKKKTTYKKTAGASRGAQSRSTGKKVVRRSSSSPVRRESASMGTSQKLTGPKLNYLGKVTHLFSKVNVAVIMIEKGQIKVNESIRIEGRNYTFDQKVTSMQVDRKPIEVAKKGQEIGVKLKKKAHVGDTVSRIL